MQGVGIEPTKALSQQILSLSPLTAWLSLLKKPNYNRYKKFYKALFYDINEDDHSNLETPVPIPNTEVKLVTLLVIVS